jgi:hypothetical protein
MNSENDICLKCGRCCYEKLITDDDIVITSVPCKYLDEKTKLCTIYNERHTLHPNCLSVQAAIERRAFPADCPYVKNIKDYKAPLFASDFEEEDLINQEALKLSKQDINGE